MSRVRIITNIGQLITMNPSISDGNSPENNELGIINNGAILVEDSTIKWIGKESDLGWDWLDMYEVINAHNNVVMPGFIDSHTHLVFAGSRHNEFEMRVQGMSYADIAQCGGGIISTVKATREIGFENLYHQSLDRLKRVQNYGVSTIEIKSGYGLSLESELKILKVINTIRKSLQIDVVPTFMGAHSLAPEFKDYNSYTEYICSEMIPEVARQKLATFCDVFCEEGYFTVEQSRKILYTAKEFGLLPKLHADEFIDSSALKLAIEVNATSADHLICMNKSLITDLANSNTIATLMPGVSLFLGTKAAPAKELLEAGVKVAIASDFNPGSNMCECLPLMMAFACFILKMTPAQVIKGVTVNAAKALNLDDRGILEPGKRADIVFFNIPSYPYLFYHYGINHLSKLIIAGEDVVL